MTKRGRILVFILALLVAASALFLTGKFKRQAKGKCGGCCERYNYVCGAD